MALFPVFFNHRLIYKIYKMLFLFSSKKKWQIFLLIYFHVWNKLTFIMLFFKTIYSYFTVLANIQRM